jgi:phasin family protein
MLNTDQFAATNKANLDVILSLTTKAFEGVEQLAALNLQVVKTGLGEAHDTARAALAVKDAQSLLALQAGVLQPAADKAAAYGRQVYDIFAATQAQVEKVASEQAAGFTKNAPEGSASGVALFKSAVAAANNAYDGLQKAARQATDAAEANYTAATGAVAKASKAKRGG